MNSGQSILREDLTSDLLDRLRQSPRVAWDIETSGLDWRRGRIGTCQLHSPTVGTVIIQVPLDRPPVLLADLLADAAVLKVFHHAPFDLRWMIGHWQAQPRSIACTKVASRLIDRASDSERHSLKHLLKHYLEVDLDKTQRTSDWLAAQLSADQLNYAALDVIYLLPLLDILEKELDNLSLHDVYLRCVNFLPTRAALEVGGWPDVFQY